MRASGSSPRSPGGTDGHTDLERVEAEIARTRLRVADSLQALRQEIGRWSDWREWVRRRPLPFLCGAFLMGVLLGSRHKR
jgi:hypothetical protein